MTTLHATGPLKMWSLGWVVILRLILYLVIIGFFVQYIYFGEKGQFYHPSEAIGELAVVFFLNLAIVFFLNRVIASMGGRTLQLNWVLAITFVLDITVLTRVILISGGFNSVFIPYYLPVLVMATVWLPRSYTAVFPSIATLGVAYVGLAHLMVSLGEMEWLSFLFPQGLLATIRFSLPHSIVASMLILAVLFFVISYLSGMLSDKLFLEQRLNTEVLSAMQEGVAVVTARGKLVYANSEFLRIFPEARETDSFPTLTDNLFHPDIDGITFERLLERSRSGMIVIAREGEAAKKLPPMEIRVSGIAVRGKRELFGLIFLVSDLTERKRMEVAERSLERFSAISTMAAGLAHEIRNPLASLRSAIQEIGEAFPEDSENRVLTDVVIAESDRLDGIISRFLDFSREGRIQPVETHLGEILANTVTMLRHDQGAGQTEIQLEVRDDLEVMCDPDRLKEVFLNLGLNALHAVPGEGGALNIILDSSDQGFTSGMEVLFIDNGPGIDGEVAKHIFEPFFSSKKGGTGMGLALSRKQVGMHGGDIEYINLGIGGTCFRVWLPLRQLESHRSATRVGISGWRRHLPNE